MSTPGQPLDHTARAFFEPRFDSHARPRAPVNATGPLLLGARDAPTEHEADRLAVEMLNKDAGPARETRGRSDLSAVRVHTGGLADASARRINAAAYTVGRHIVFAAGRFAPGTAAGRQLLAHELAHVAQPGNGRVVRRQDASAAQAGAPAPAQPASGLPAPRQDYVFIMGEDPRRTDNPFYSVAERHYRSHLPGATFVTHTRNLADLLSWVATNVSAPIGNLYIVAHANEDGTLSFGLDPGDADRHLAVSELRDAIHPPSGGASTLPGLTNQIDAQTRIHIKGCDIGRTQAMVELIDEAFGGAGTVTAPTHEQGYGWDPELARQATTRFRAGVEAAHPMPPQVDPSLRGRERAQAVSQRQQALRERQREIQTELTARRAEEQRLAEEAGRYESFSGPMFQRPGTQLFSAAELAPEVDRLYSHLSPAQRRSLVTRLVARDPRPPAQAAQQGTFRQQGQRLDRRTTFSYRFEEPRTVQEAIRLYGTHFRAQNFTPTSVRLNPQSVSGGTQITVEVEGTVAVRGQQPSTQTITFTSNSPVPDDAAMMQQGQAQVGNPNRYNWRIEESHSSDGHTTRTVVAERVVAYLHHGSLDPSAREHFTRPLTDPNYFTTSTFAPPAAPAPTP